MNLNHITSAKSAALKSIANKRKVGAFIITTEHITCSGYNHMSYMLDSDQCENIDGDSYECVIHAEQHAILKALKDGLDLTDGEIYCTYSPCMNCCKLIVESGLKKLVYIEEHKSNFNTPEIKYGYSPKSYLQDAGVEILHFDESVQKHNDQIKMAIIYHSADPDGLMSAYLLKKIYENISHIDITMIPWNYNKDAEWLTNFVDFDIYLFGDICPTSEWVTDKYIDIKSEKIKIIIFDHHKDRHDSLIENYPEFFDNNNFIYSEKYSASYLINKNKSHLLNNNYDEIVSLISDYDVWAFDAPEFDIKLKEKVLCFSEFLFQHNDFSDFSEIIDKIILLNNNKMDDEISLSKSFGINYIIQKGMILINKLKSDNKKIIKTGKFYHNDFLFTGYPNYFLTQSLKEICPTLRYLVGMQLNLHKGNVKFSVRSEFANCLTIAKKYDGGGHKLATGFTIPITKINDFLNDVESIFKT